MIIPKVMVTGGGSYLCTGWPLLVWYWTFVIYGNKYILSCEASPRGFYSTSKLWNLIFCISHVLFFFHFYTFPCRTSSSDRREYHLSTFWADSENLLNTCFLAPKFTSPFKITQGEGIFFSSCCKPALQNCIISLITSSSARCHFIGIAIFIVLAIAIVMVHVTVQIMHQSYGASAALFTWL